MNPRLRMLIGTVPLALQLACASTGDAATAGGAGQPPAAVPATAPARDGQRLFSLAVGQSAHWPELGLQVGLSGVRSDSRCPRGEQCVWAGDAVVLVWLAQAGEPRREVELHTGPGLARSVAVGARSLRLLRLDPEPVSGRRIDPATYVASFALDTERSGPAPDSAER